MTTPAPDAAARPVTPALDGTTVAVVGASSGIGRATAAAAYHAGADVVLLARSRERLDEAATSLADCAASFAGHRSPRVVTQVLDARDAAATERAFAAVGSLDHLVVTAVADEARLFAPLTEINDDVARRSMDKFWISFHTVRAAARRIAATGSVTLTASSAVLRPPAGGGASVMNAASGAVAVLGRALAAELAPVRVNVVAPGVVATGVWDDRQRLDLDTWARDTLPVRHLGQPHELAATYLHLMTATYLTGALIPIDGGLTLT